MKMNFLKKSLTLATAVALSSTMVLADANGGGSQSAIDSNNTIVNPVISVTLPTVLPFAIDGYSQESGAFGQIKSGNFQMVNKSNIPVKVELESTFSSVASTPATLVAANAVKPDDPTATTKNIALNMVGVKTIGTAPTISVKQLSEFTVENPAVTDDGNLTISDDASSPNTVTVAILKDDTAEAVATKIAAACEGNNAFSTLYTTTAKEDVVYIQVKVPSATAVTFTAEDAGTTGVGTMTVTTPRAGAVGTDMATFTYDNTNAASVVAFDTTTKKAKTTFVLEKATDDAYVTDSTKNPAFEATDLAAGTKGYSAVRFTGTLNTYAPWAASDVKLTSIYTITGLTPATYTSSVQSANAITDTLNMTKNTTVGFVAPAVGFQVASVTTTKVDTAIGFKAGASTISKIECLANGAVALWALTTTQYTYAGNVLTIKAGALTSGKTDTFKVTLSDNTTYTMAVTVS